MEDDKARRRAMIAIIGFCTMIMIYMFGRMLLSRTPASFGHFILAIVLGAIVAGITYGVTVVMDL